MSDLLVVEKLVKHFPIRRGVIPRPVGHVRAVDGISLHIPRGTTLGLVGESGCGKTTAGRCILRLIEPTSGRVTFDGRDVLSLKGPELRQIRREMQIIFQDPFGSLNPRMTIGAMLEEPLLVHGIGNGGSEGTASAPAGRRRARERAIELLELVGLAAEHAGRYPHEFSGGQRQRVGIARALTLRPRFIVCDEAVSALDVSIQAQILNLLSDLQKQFQLTYLFIAHDLGVVRHLCDRVAVMYLGQIVEEADTESLFARPLHPYTRALLDSIPVAHPRDRRERDQVEGDPPNPADPPPGCRFEPRCSIAREDCKRVDPELVEIAAEHRSACLRADELASGLV